MDLNRNVMRRVATKALWHGACSAPLIALILEVVFHPDRLGANPVATLIHTLGLWALRLLLVTLAITPLRYLTGRASWLQYRRLLGLWAAFYALLHLIAYAGIDQRGDWHALTEDVLKRPWITIGMAGEVILWVLALTSIPRIVRALGRRWRTVHLAVYGAAALGLWHFAWQVKKDLRAPLVYIAIFSVLMLYRILRRRFKAPSAPATVQGKSVVLTP